MTALQQGWHGFALCKNQQQIYWAIVASWKLDGHPLNQNQPGEAAFGFMLHQLGVLGILK